MPEITFNFAGVNNAVPYYTYDGYALDWPGITYDAALILHEYGTPRRFDLTFEVPTDYSMDEYLVKVEVTFYDDQWEYDFHFPNGLVCTAIL